MYITFFYPYILQFRTYDHRLQFGSGNDRGFVDIFWCMGHIISLDGYI